MDTSKPRLKVRSLGLWRVPGPFTIMITAKQMFSEGGKKTQEGFVQFQQLRDLVDLTLLPNEKRHYSESPCLWTAATAPSWWQPHWCPQQSRSCVTMCSQQQ